MSDVQQWLTKHEVDIKLLKNRIQALEYLARIGCLGFQVSSKDRVRKEIEQSSDLDDEVKDEIRRIAGIAG